MSPDECAAGTCQKRTPAQTATAPEFAPFDATTELERLLELAEARVDQLTDELALTRDTLTHRTRALNETGTTNDTLRATIARARVLVECWASTPGSLITRGNAAIALDSALDPGPVS